MKRIAFVFLFTALLSSYCSAMTIPYSLAGTASFWEPSTPSANENYDCQISGIINFSPFGDITEFNGRIYEAIYPIDFFLITFLDYSFTGNGFVHITPSDMFMNLYGSGDFEHMLFCTEYDGFSTNCALPQSYSIAATRDYIFPNVLPNSTLEFGVIGLNLNAVPVPEPSTILLICLGAASAIMARRRKPYLRC